MFGPGNAHIDFIAPGKHHGEIDLCTRGKLETITSYTDCLAYVRQLCIFNGTTLEGSYEASKALLMHGYMRPIYIGGWCNQILIPLSAMDDVDGVWVSLDYLLSHEQDEFNVYGYKKITIRQWQKRLADGILLKNMIQYHRL